MTAPATILERVIAVVDAETQGLRDDPAFDVHASSLRKHRLLLDLHYLGAGDVAPERLERLRAALNENRAELAARLAAARLVADLAIGIVREDGRDGTYGQASAAGPASAVRQASAAERAP